MRTSRFNDFKLLSLGLALVVWLACLGNAAEPGLFRTILAGDETALPFESPSARLDLLRASSPFNAVGALDIYSGGFSYRGKGTALSPNWVLTAGHNLDLNDNSSPDTGLSIHFNNA